MALLETTAVDFVVVDIEVVVSDNVVVVLLIVVTVVNKCYLRLLRLLILLLLWPCLLLLVTSYLVVVNKCLSEAPEGHSWVSVVGWWGREVCTVIFISNPTTVLRLCCGCVMLSLGLWQLRLIPFGLTSLLELSKIRRNKVLWLNQPNYKQVVSYCQSRILFFELSPLSFCDFFLFLFLLACILNSDSQKSSSE